jgi:hypothetical protein
MTFDYCVIIKLRVERKGSAVPKTLCDNACISLIPTCIFFCLDRKKLEVYFSCVSLA